MNTKQKQLLFGAITFCGLSFFFNYLFKKEAQRLLNEEVDQQIAELNRLEWLMDSSSY